MEDGTICNVYGKPLHFGKDGCTTTIIAGKPCRVSRIDICRCVAEKSDISLIYPKRRKHKVAPTKRAILNRYRELSAQISLIASAIIEDDRSKLLLFLVERIPNYIAHFAYTRLSADYLYDVIFEQVESLCDSIMRGSKIVIAPDRYIIEMSRTALSKDVTLKRKEVEFR